MTAPAADVAAGTVILFRSHRDTPYIRDRFDFLRTTSGLKVVPLYDQTNDKAGFGDVEAVRIDDAAFAALGLSVLPGNAWRCGDYGLYAALGRFPATRFFWLVEYDVLFAFPRASDVFDRYAGLEDVDLLAGDVRPAEPDWYWSETMVGEGVVPWRCFFPVVRLSRRAIEHLLAARRALGTGPAPGRRWPNDEAFVATRLANDGFKVADLNCRGTVYTRGSYRFEWPIAYESVAGRTAGLLVHPVLDAAERAAKPARSNVSTIAYRLQNGLRHVKADARLWRDLRRGGGR